MKVLYILISIILLSGGCVNHEEPDLPVAPEGKVLLELYSTAETYHLPRSGVADETSITAPPWVFVSQVIDDDAIVYEIRQSFVLGSKTYVALYENDNPCRLLIVANPPAMVRNAAGDEFAFDQTNLDDQFLGQTFSYLVDNLLTSPLLDVPQPTVPYTPGLPLPMSAVLELNSIDDNTIINNQVGGALPLSRVVAKVTVDATAAGPDFTLLGATVTGVPRNGALAGLNGLIKDNSGNLTDYISPVGDAVTGIAAATGNTTAANPIYVYESAETETSIVLKGINNGVEGYYRLDFQIAGQPVNVLRNHSYTFVVGVVEGTGSPTLAQALANPPSNIVATLLVTDLSTEIVSNGQYYLGTTNSETIIFGDAIEQNNIRVTTVTTNAPVTVADRTITATGAGLSAATTAISVTGGVVSTDINVNLTAAFTSGTITLRLDNIVKTILVSRTPALGIALTTTEFADNYVSAEVTSGSPWLSVSAVNILSTGSSTARNNLGAGDMYMFTQTNLGTAERTGTLYLSRADQQGRTLVYVTQQALGIIEPVDVGYTGTFHRWNQTGERVITIPYTTDDPPTNGTWTATVIGGDFIILDTALPGRARPLTGDAEAFQVGGTATSVTGNATGAASPIYFRVGLTGTLAAPTNTPRYGLILLQYNNNTRQTVIWVRQGEAADYVMRNADPTSGTTTLTVPRSLARRLSPFNITDPLEVLGAAPIDRGTRGYVFTDYPTKAGYYFQWYQTRCWDPSTPSVTWDDPAITGFWNTAWETCPPGYHRPADGTITAYLTTATANNSEIRQSLYLNPQDDSTPNTDNSVWGYYADGFFDRQVTYPNFVAGSGADVAYAGRLYFNPYNFASVFIPSTGYRFAGPGGTFTFQGTFSYNWTATSSSTTTSWGMVSTETASEFLQLNRATGFCIRCVAD